MKLQESFFITLKQWCDGLYYNILKEPNEELNAFIGRAVSCLKEMKMVPGEIPFQGCKGS